MSARLKWRRVGLGSLGQTTAPVLPDPNYVELVYGTPPSNANWSGFSFQIIADNRYRFGVTTNPNLMSTDVEALFSGELTLEAVANVTTASPDVGMWWVQGVAQTSKILVGDASRSFFDGAVQRGSPHPQPTEKPTAAANPGPPAFSIGTAILISVAGSVIGGIFWAMLRAKEHHRARGRR